MSNPIEIMIQNILSKGNQYGEMYAQEILKNNPQFAQQIQGQDLRKLGTVSFETGLSIISVVGDLRSDNLGFEAKVTDALKDIPVRMISYGGSDHNISLLVRTDDKVRALRALSKTIF